MSAREIQNATVWLSEHRDMESCWIRKKGKMPYTEACAEGQGCATHMMCNSLTSNQPEPRSRLPGRQIERFFVDREEGTSLWTTTNKLGNPVIVSPQARLALSLP